MAEETGLITQIDEFVQPGVSDVAAWQRAGFGDIRLSVNLSAMQLEQENFCDRFVSALQAPACRQTCEAGAHRKHAHAGHGDHHSRS